MTAPNNTAAGSGWKVTGQQEQDAVINGNVVPSMVVSFLTREGVAASVSVPLQQYTPDKVAQLIAERATIVDAVHQLEG